MTIVTEKRPMLRRHFWIVSVIIVAGALLRLALYFDQRDLWVDECMLALGVIWNPLPLISGALVYEQQAPVGYLYLLKLITLSVGITEQMFRFPALLASIGLLPLAVLVMRRLELHIMAIVSVLFLLTVNPMLLRYANDMKQYSLDAFLAMVLVYAFFAWRERTVLVALLLATGTLLSHPFIFSATVFIFAHVVEHGRLRDQRNLLWISSILVPFVVSFVLFTIPGLQTVLNHPYIRGYHDPAFAPLDLLSVETYQWYVKTAHRIIRDMMFWRYPLAAALLIGLGITRMWQRRDVSVLLLLLGPLMVAVAASSMHLYTTHHRLLIFSLPMLFVLLGVGVSYLLERVRPLPVTWVVLLVLLVAGFTVPTTRVASYLRGTHEFGVHEEIGKAYALLRSNRGEDEKLYIPWNIYPNMYYYALRDRAPVDFPMNRWTFPPDPPTVEDFAEQIEHGLKVGGWVIISHRRMHGDAILPLLRARGWTVVGYTTPEGSAGAYRLRRE